MNISYKPLWRILFENDLRKGDLKDIAGITWPTIAKLSKNEYVAMEVLVRICKALNCQLSDIVEVVSEEDNKKE